MVETAVIVVSAQFRDDGCVIVTDLKSLLTSRAAAMQTSHIAL